MRVECVELFDVERRRERRDRFIRLVVMAIFALAAVSFGQVIDTDFDSKLTLVKTNAFGYVKIAANIVLFFMFLAKVIPALTGGQKDQNWWELIGILAAVIIVNIADNVWETITGGVTGQ